jgi:hypothetical protein
MNRTGEQTRAVERAAGPPDMRPARARSTLLTTAAVCVIAACLAVVGWVHSSMRDAADESRRYAVAEPPAPAATSPQPLVPLLPPDATGKGVARSAKPLRTATSRPVPAVTGPAGAISGYAGKCLRVPGDHPVDGIPVEMTACDASAGQRWIMARDGTVRALGKCLEVLGGQAADGARIQVAACRGGAAQQWRFTAGRDLVNPAADKCLDVKDFDAADGAALQLWTCAGSANQKWSVPVAG